MTCRAGWKRLQDPKERIERRMFTPFHSASPGWGSGAISVARGGEGLTREVRCKGWVDPREKDFGLPPRGIVRTGRDERGNKGRGLVSWVVAPERKGGYAVQSPL
jgi:hypothetical protein